MESAVLIHPALEFLLTVLPLAPDCPTTDQKPAPRLPHTCPSSGAVVGQIVGQAGVKLSSKLGQSTNQLIFIRSILRTKFEQVSDLKP